MGFTFDDTDTKGIASSLADMEHVLASSPQSKQLIVPYIGGQEVNSTPDFRHHRFVINFGDMEEEEARQWPELFSIVEERVLPERRSSSAKSSTGKLVSKFWQYGHTAKSLYESIRGLNRVLCTLRVSEHSSFVFLSTDYVFANTLYIFPFDSDAHLCLLQSRVHETWGRFFSSTLEERQTFHPTDCFETFSFPDDIETSSTLRDVGREYYEHRTNVMSANQEGLTKTYNRFHDPDEASPEITKLRDLHDEMDRTVLRAYGWVDLAEQATCDFLLDYEEEEDDDRTAKKSKKKKPWRYRWPDEFRDEVLARLLELNEQRAREEKLAGKTAEAKAKSDGAKSRGRKSAKKK